MQFLPFILAAIGWLLMAWIGDFSQLIFSLGLSYIIACAFVMLWLYHQDDSLAKLTRRQVRQQDIAMLFIATCLLFAVGIAICLWCLLLYFSCAFYWVLWKAALLIGNQQAATRYHIALHERASFFGGLREPPVIIRD